MRARHTVSFRSLPVNLAVAAALALGLVACGSDPSVERKPFDGQPIATPTAGTDGPTAKKTGTGDVKGETSEGTDPDSPIETWTDGPSPKGTPTANPTPGGKPACVSDEKSTCGPFAAELVAACLKFSTKNEEGRAACLGDRWAKPFHAQLTAHLAASKGTEAASEAAYAKVMPHILHWEGGCSDHPADAGGRTFKGITTATARSYGFKGDVCTLPGNLVMAIYRDRYWEPRARLHAWPLNLAIMNTEVNSGGGRAEEFLARMKAQNVGGTLVDKAKWFVDQQTAFYRAIVARTPSQNVFLAGWLNRSAYMKALVSGEMNGEPSLALLNGEGEEVVPTTPKAY